MSQLERHAGHHHVRASRPLPSPPLPSLPCNTFVCQGGGVSVHELRSVQVGASATQHTSLPPQLPVQCPRPLPQALRVRVQPPPLSPLRPTRAPHALPQPFPNPPLPSSLTPTCVPATLYVFDASEAPRADPRPHTVEVTSYGAMYTAVAATLELRAGGFVLFHGATLLRPHHFQCFRAGGHESALDVRQAPSPHREPLSDTYVHPPEITRLLDFNVGQNGALVVVMKHPNAACALPGCPNPEFPLLAEQIHDHTPGCICSPTLRIRYMGELEA